MPRLSKKEKKLEKQKKAQEKKRTNLLDTFSREIRYGNITRKRHERDWKEMVYKIGLEMLREDFEYTWHSFEFAMDIKDFTISKLMDDLQKSNDQYSLNLQNHNSRIELMIHHLNDALKLLHDDYLSEQKRLIAEYQFQVDKCEKSNHKMQEHLKTILHKMESQYIANMKEQQAVHFCLVESFITDANSEMLMGGILMKKMNNTWIKSCEELDKYFKKYEVILNAMRYDSTACESSDSIIKKNLKKLVHLLNVVKKLQAKLKLMEGTEGLKLSRLRDNHTEFSDILFILKDKIFKDTRLDEAQQRLLISTAITTLDQFGKIIRKGEFMLKVMSINRKYEMSQEKVLPYPVSSSWVGHSSKRDFMDLGARLNLFFQRMGNANASRMAVLEEKRVLELENLLLKSKIAKYCGCLVCLDKYTTLINKSKEIKEFNCATVEGALNIEKQKLIDQNMPVTDKSLSVSFNDSVKGFMLLSLSTESSNELELA